MYYEEQLVLVDINDNMLGTVSKNYAHIKALLHRAFSIMIYNSEGKILLQKRADNKYHSAGLWSNYTGLNFQDKIPVILCSTLRYL